MSTHTLFRSHRAAVATAALVGLAAFGPVSAAATDIPVFRVTLRGQLALAEDPGYAAFGDTRLLGGGEIGLDALFGEHLMVGLSYIGRGKGGEVYDAFDTELDADGLRASAGWRWPLSSWFQAYARGGVEACWWLVSFDPTDTGRTMESHDFRPGFFAGAGLDVWLVSPDLLPDGQPANRFSLGLNAELTYDRFLPVEVKAGRALGDFDPSGPGFLVGAAVQF